MTPIVESYRWSPDGPKILTPETLARLKAETENKGPLIVEHRFYCGGCAPDRHIFEQLEDLLAYLDAKAKPGDDIWVWSYWDLCGDENSIARGKISDDQGRVPLGGAY